jgi:tetratricopeptide (TPR) repeat protein
MAETLIAQDKRDEAEPLYVAALEKSERLGDPETTVRTQARLAALYVRTGRAEQAVDLAAKAESTARKMNYLRGMADALAVQGDLAQQREDSSAAQRHYAEAYRLYTILHDPAAARVAKLLPSTA